MFCRNGRNDNIVRSTSITSRTCDANSMKGLSPIRQTDPDNIALRRTAGTVSRKSVSSGCVEDHRGTGSKGEEVKVAVRLAKSENGTFSSRRRQPRKPKSRNYRGGPRRHLATSSKHVTVTSSGKPQGPHGVTSSDSQRESLDVTSRRESPVVTSSAGNPPTPRSRSSYERDHRDLRRAESPALTSSGKHREQSGIAHHVDSASAPARRLDPRYYVRPTSVPPPSSLAPNPFSPFWNFLFKGRGTSSGADDEHVCNTARTRHDSSWFGSSAIITNVYLSTINRWTGVWPTASGYLAGASRDGGPAVESIHSVSHRQPRCHHTFDQPRVRTTRTRSRLILRKTIKTVTTICQILRLKYTKIKCRLGLFASDSAGKVYSAPSEPLAGLKEAYF